MEGDPVCICDSSAKIIQLGNVRGGKVVYFHFNFYIKFINIVHNNVVFFYDTMCFFIILLCLFYFLEEAIVIVCKINWVKVQDCRDESSVS